MSVEITGSKSVEKGNGIDTVTSALETVNREKRVTSRHRARSSLVDPLTSVIIQTVVATNANRDIHNTNGGSKRQSETPASLGTINEGISDQLFTHTLTTRWLIVFFYILRLVGVAVTFMVLLIAVNYAIGQLYENVTFDIFCGNKSWAQVLEHSRANNLNGGDDSTAGSCWRIGQENIDFLKARSDAALTPMAAPSQSNAARASLFFIVGAFLLYLCVLYTYYFINDIFFTLTSQDNPRFLIDADDTDRKPIQSLTDKIHSTMDNWYIKYKNWFHRYYYTDSSARILSHWVSEICETLIQMYALFILGGNPLFHTGEVVLAQTADDLRHFVCILGLNGICTALVWLPYALWPDRFCGRTHETIVFVVDMSFEIWYTVYPMTLVSSGLFNTKAMASLNSEDHFLFIQAFIPLCLVVHKCWNVLANLDPVYLRSVTTEFLDMEERRHHFKPFLHTQSFLQHRNRTESAVELASPSTLDGPTSCATASNSMSAIRVHRTWFRSILDHQGFRRSSVFMFGFLFLMFGCTILGTCLTYIDSAEDKCNDASEDFIAEHAEMLFWDDCETPVVVLGKSDYPCNCRTWKRAHRSDVDQTVHDALASVLKSWDMLTVFSFETKVASETPFYLTADALVASKLRYLFFLGLNIGQIDSAIGDLKDLEVVAFRTATLNQSIVPWNALSRLKKLTVLDLYASIDITDFDMNICELSELRSLTLTGSSITEIPDCVGDFHHLISIGIDLMALLTTIPLSLFEIGTLRNVIADYTSIDFNDYSEAFSFSNSIEKIWLQETPLCDTYHSLGNASMPVDVPMWTFLNQTNACRLLGGNCSAQSIVGADACTAFYWHNGDCYEECNTKECDWDGGDCNQLCDLELCPLDILGDGNCDIACNTSVCDYDKYDCIETEVIIINTTKICDASVGCKEYWTDEKGDGWCDDLCRSSDDPLCNAETACNGCSDDCYDRWYIFYVAASASPPVERLSLEELCNRWDLLLAFVGDVEWDDCNALFADGDTNGDDEISLYEFIVVAANYWDDTFVNDREKLLQVNCSMCMIDPSLYS